ncbi:hypothetical protein [Anabaena azotica]|uniref:Uncharacterized protein n=1 Tax=Anabaena azotica FACHB-119 TaxID=947527 RepID=A0ABR8D784_9NOST|nr:hypothetical protein [Anabaena azotica]MBD2502102.1 hypothetical protein [Anabaena azotica FACHB-119]
MSYLNKTRLVFAGDFQSDVSTVNNDVRHYDNATFEKRFQDFSKGEILNGWWNPIGSGAFRLINCRVKSVFIDGQMRKDSALNLVIDGSNNRVGGKMVDLDPQFQMASAIWGLTIRLTDGQRDFLVGQFEPASFRDIMFGRRQKARASTGASAAFQSVLTNLQWGNDLEGSSFLEELKAALPKENGKLSIRFTTFGYSTDKNDERFTLGKVIGAIGPYYENEPHSFVLGRRMVPNLDKDTGAPLNKINFFDALVNEQENSVSVDLGNALPLNFDLTLQDLGELQLAVIDKNIQESQCLEEGIEFVALGSPIPYHKRPGWLYNTAGIWATSVDAEQLEYLHENPLALIQRLDDGRGKVLVRESIDGLFVRADKFVQRVEPTETAEIELFASRYGKPLPNTSVSIAFSCPDNTAGGGSPKDPAPPQAQIPWTDWPKSALKNLPLTLTTDTAGKAKLSIETEDPGNPRGYIDGQIYTLQYSLQGQADSQKQSLDAIYVLLFDAYAIPVRPTWLEHIHPIFQQYGNLYPIMSKRLVDLGDYDSVRENRAILELAFSLDIHDPNSMPVTRDLSRAKRVTILRWLQEKSTDGSYVLRLGQKPSQAEGRQTIEKTSIPSLVLESQDTSAPIEDDSTAHGYQNLQIALRRIQGNS